jgi:hypothetical protein
LKEFSERELWHRWRWLEAQAWSQLIIEVVFEEVKSQKAQELHYVGAAFMMHMFAADGTEGVVKI